MEDNNGKFRVYTLSNRCLIEKFSNKCLPAKCGKDQKYWEGSCYYFQRTIKMTWYYARKNCSKQTMTLISLETEREYEFVKKSYFQDKKFPVLIGLTDENQEGEFYWEGTGKILGSFTSWQPGEPNNQGLRENQVHININGWNDIDKNLPSYWVCEKILI
ncbi:unnamed protein product [Dimorphilus gyrociliatus]|uniref:C-type lectin domain-containing protein n=1 Tax=Dimorphilus gyrociliatus TaxID=2664684 RepID=A0A7I8WC88_9ANNE|nr:unnamed protein product [Dimorphilus gyrociliatus]